MQKDLYHRQNARIEHANAWFGPDPTAYQKIAPLAAHAPLYPGARLADMGCGFGEGTYYLALNHPQVEVVGVDIDPERVRRAQENYERPNLKYVVANAEKLPDSLGRFDGVLYSSSIHHFYSYNHYDEGAVRRALKHQYARLITGGVMVIRDFVAWPDEYVLMDLPHDREGNTPQTMSSADLFVLFAQVARSLFRTEDQGFMYEEIKSFRRKGWRRFGVSAKWGAEFAWRKDYLRTFEGEAEEEYSCWQARDYGRELSALGGRVVYAGPSWNRWMVQNRYKGKIHFWDKHGNPYGFPPTNYIAVVQKTPSGASQQLCERRLVAVPADPYIQVKSYRDTQTGMLYDMAMRKGGSVIDVLPYGFVRGEVAVYANAGYPRPLTQRFSRGSGNPDGKVLSGHIIQPIAAANIKPGDDLREKMIDKAGLRINRSLAVEHVKNPEQALSYLPAAGLADERVDSYFLPVDLEAIPDRVRNVREISPHAAGLSTAGEVRLYLAQDILRAAQVGLLPEARLELNVYALLRHLGRAPAPWLDGVMAKPPVARFEIGALTALLAQNARTVFQPSSQSAGYISHYRSLFQDLNGKRQRAAREHEFILPAKASMNAGVVIPLARNEDDKVCIGMKEIDLPAAQTQEGNSRLFVAPIYRFPHAVETIFQAEDFVTQKIGADPAQVRRLGEGFYSSIGLTPERLFPFVAFVDPAQIKEDLHFTPLTDLFAHLESLRDAPLMIGAMRAVHALDLWGQGMASLKAKKSLEKAAKCEL